jgi:hypothetical protein
MIRSVCWSSCKLCVILVVFKRNVNFHDRILKNTHIKFHENPSSRGRVVYGDEQTDMTTLIVALCNIANAPNNYSNNAKNVWCRSTKLRCPDKKGFVPCWVCDMLIKRSSQIPVHAVCKGGAVRTYPILPASPSCGAPRYYQKGF